jgi:hypothetical protein
VIAHFGSRQKTIVQMQLAAKELSVSLQSNCANSARFAQSDD